MAESTEVEVRVPSPYRDTHPLQNCHRDIVGLWDKRGQGPGLRLTSLREELCVNEFEGVFIHQARGTLLQQEVTLSSLGHPKSRTQLLPLRDAYRPGHCWAPPALGKTWRSGGARQGVLGGGWSPQPSLVPVPPPLCQYIDSQKGAGAFRFWGLAHTLPKAGVPPDTSLIEAPG